MMYFQIRSKFLVEFFQYALLIPKCNQINDNVIFKCVKCKNSTLK